MSEKITKVQLESDRLRGYEVQLLTEITLADLIDLLQSKGITAQYIPSHTGGRSSILIKDKD